jgi:protein-disulfide isomerase
VGKAARQGRGKGKSRKQANAKPFIGIIIVVVVLGAAALGYAVTRNSVAATTVDASIPAGQAEGYLIGKADAPVQVSEFADYECPACGVFATLTEPDVRSRLVETGTVAYRFYDFPLPMHKNTWAASNAAACASDQGKFWEMHDLIFASQDRWNGAATSNPKKPLTELARQLGLDVKAWESCFDSKKHYGRIKGNQAEAERRMVQQTPTFIIGDKMLPGSLSFDQFKAWVDTALKSAPKTGAKPAEAAKKGAGR